MVITDSTPPYILGVSNSFDVLPNSATLTTDKSQYYDGEWVDVSFTMNQTVDSLEYKFAWIGLFRQDAQNYSLPPLDAQFYYPWLANPTRFSSRNLPVDSKLKAVMVITDSNPLRILGISQNFQVFEFGAPTPSPIIGFTPAPVSTSIPTSAAPIHTSNPTAPPVACPIGTFTKDCLPLVAIDTVVPSGGLLTGGFAVRVSGFNFGTFSSATVICHFGAANVGGIYKSDKEVECIAPDVSQAGIVVEDSAVVMFSVSIGGQTSYNSESFEFFGLCHRNGCVNGYCAVTGCICDSGFQGEGCVTAVVPPRVKAANSSIVQVRENDKFSYFASVDEGDSPISWKVEVDPPQDDIYINPSTGALEWDVLRPHLR
jgi:hypothetical protein